MILRLATAPTKEPLTGDQAKEHLRLESTADDVYVNALIVAARQYIEKILWRGLVEQTWELVQEQFPCDDFITLPKGNLLSLVSAQYLDVDGNLQTLSSSVYELDTKSVPGKMRLKYQQAWPLIRERWNAVQLQYKVGFGTDGDAVPAPVKQAMLLLISQMYEHRTPEIMGTIIAKVGFAVDALVAPYRLRRF